MRHSKLILVLLLLPSFCLAGGAYYLSGGLPWLAAGSVTAANMRLSAVNGAAFADFSAAGVLTDYLNKYLRVTDSAGKYINGYIKAAGGGETLGAELVADGGFAAVTEGNDVAINGGFDSDASWTYRNPTSWAILGGLLTSDGSVVNDDVYQNINAVDNNCYKVVFTVSGYASGTVFVRVGDGGQTVPVNSDGTYTQYLRAIGNAYFYIKTGAAGFVGSIDNVSVKNITFTNWSSWPPQTTEGALTDKAYKSIATSANLEQNSLAAEAGKLYKIVWTLAKLAGDAGDGITVEFGSTDGTLRTANGTYTDYVVAIDTDYLKFKPTDSDADLAVTIDDVSVKQVTAPAATGVTITNTKAGATYNWKSKDAAFNYGDASGYTYKIYNLQ